MHAASGFSTLFGTLAGTWPLAVRAQQKAMPVVGWLISVSAERAKPFLAAFRQGLGETGYVEGHDVTTEYRWADGHYGRLPSLAADLVGRKVDVIATRRGPFSARGKERDLDNPDCLRRRRRPGHGRVGRQLRAARRQSDRLQHPQR
jgi:putative tryptophan/tyrosine transport system substrate-binding protein